MHDTPVFAGVDIARLWLDAALTCGATHRFTNTAKGWSAFVRWARQHGVTAVAYEPTGRYHQPFERAVAAAGVALVKVNPRNARRFAEARGRLARTDRTDAETLCVMASALNLAPTALPDADVMRLRELVTARQAAMRDLVAHRNRLAGVHEAVLTRHIKAMITRLERHLAAIDAAADAVIAASAALSARYEVLRTVPGFGRHTAVEVLAAMPELGGLDGKAAASLTGLAPMARDSGLTRGRRFIRGGRFAVRRALHMAALGAIRSKTRLASRYRAMRTAGKPAKVAIVALMRKLIVIANAILRDNTTWQPVHD